MVSRILVPMDNSAHADEALGYALDNHPDAAITVLHVVGVPSMFMGDAVGLALEDDIREGAAERARPIFERAETIAESRDRDIETVVGIGHPARNILDRADEYDTVVLGAHGKHADRVTRQVLVGNIAETVVRRAPVPVIIVR